MKKLHSHSSSGQLTNSQAAIHKPSARSAIFTQHRFSIPSIPAHFHFSLKFVNSPGAGIEARRSRTYRRYVLQRSPGFSKAILLYTTLDDLLLSPSDLAQSFFPSLSF